MTLIDKIVHYILLLLIRLVFKLVYLSAKVLKNITLLCIIFILVLLTHIYSGDPGKARGGSTNTFVINWLINSVIFFLHITLFYGIVLMCLQQWLICCFPKKLLLETKQFKYSVLDQATLIFSWSLDWCG